MNKWRADAAPERIAEAIRALAGLAAQIPEVRGWYQGETRTGDGDDFDFVLVVDFDDEPAFERYLQHPAHLHVVSNLVRPILASTVRIRCELAS